LCSVSFLRRHTRASQGIPAILSLPPTVV